MFIFTLRVYFEFLIDYSVFSFFYIKLRICKQKFATFLCKGISAVEKTLKLNLAKKIKFLNPAIFRYI